MAGQTKSGIVDIRLALAFHQAPDVHTLLYLTPARERGKLIIEALERYIRTTGHPAGSKPVQLQAVDAWLQGLPCKLDETIRGAHGAAGTSKSHTVSSGGSGTQQGGDTATSSARGGAEDAKVEMASSSDGQGNAFLSGELSGSGEPQDAGAAAPAGDPRTDGTSPTLASGAVGRWLQGI